MSSLNFSLTPFALPGSHEAASFGSFHLLVLSMNPTVSMDLPPSSQPVSPAQLNDDKINKLLQMGTSDSFLCLFHHSNLMTFTAVGHHAFQCPLCDTHVHTSIPSSILLTSSGQFHTLTSHYHKRTCLSALACKEKHTVTAVLQQMGTVTT